jgi:hypothetical protein
MDESISPHGGLAPLHHVGPDGASLARHVGGLPRPVLFLPVSGEQIVVPEAQLETLPEADNVRFGYASRDSGTRQLIAGVAGACLPAEEVTATRKALGLVEQQLEP